MKHKVNRRSRRDKTERGIAPVPSAQWPGGTPPTPKCEPSLLNISKLYETAYGVILYLIYVVIW